MKKFVNRIPFLGYQLFAWFVWGALLWMYMNKVVPGAFRGVGDWAIMMGIHMVTANLTAFAVGPRVMALCKQRRFIRAMFLGVGFLLGIAIFALILSIAVQAMTIRSTGPDSPDPEIVNMWQTLMVLFGGVVMGAAYCAALWMRHVLRLDKLQYDELEQRLQSATDDHTLERLNGQLIPHLVNNLMNTLNFTVKWRPDKIEYMVHAISQFTKSYGRSVRQVLIPLADELALLELYIEVIHIQLGYRPYVKVDVAGPPDRGTGCIPMLLILLVENMKKYAVLSDSAHPAVIYIRVKDGRLIVRATNRKRHPGKVFSTQTGLRNLTSRLRLLWGEDAHIAITGLSDMSHTFSINICCHTELFA